MPTVAESRGRRVLAFGALYLTLQWVASAWREHDGAWWLVDQATARPAGRLIGAMWPDEHVRAFGGGLAWPGGSLQLARGCDGLEVLTLFVAAVLVAPVGWRRGLQMLALGTALTWAGNQARVLLLYFSWRHWPQAFDVLHVLVAPIALLFALLVLFRWQLRSES